MINLWSQLAASSALAIMAIILHVLIRNDGNVSKLDPARYYTMVRERGDVPGARSLLDNDQNWLKESCRASLTVAYSANPSNECVQLRVALRNGILDKMKCLSYNSQVCSYLRLITSGIIKNVSTNVVGRSLSGLAPNSTTLTYRQLLLNAIDTAPYMFHNSYRAAQSDDLYVSRTILYNLIIFTILANMVVHFLDTYSMTWTRRLLTRIIVFVLSTMVAIFVFLNTSSGNTLTTVVGIWLPSLFILVYFEALLDHTISRPWIHPYTFSIIFSTMSILALTENNVLNYDIVAMGVVLSHVASMLYLQVVWYWVGYKEKKHKGIRTEATHAAKLYTTKEMQYALYMALVILSVVPFFLILGPFDYNSGDVTQRIAPLMFLVLSLFGTLYLQGLKLDDEYGIDAIEPPASVASDQKEVLIWSATRVTGGKLGVSLLLLLFGFLYELNIVGDYFRDLRAYSDKIPDRAWQYDTASKFTIGTGFMPTASNLLYL